MSEFLLHAADGVARADAGPPPAATPAAQRPARHPALVIGGLQRVGAFAALPSLLERMGADPAAVLRAGGLARNALHHPHQRVAYASMSQVLGSAARATSCEHFGLLAGAAWRARDLGLVGEVIRHAPTVGEALASSIAHHWKHSPGATQFVLHNDDTVHLGYCVYASGVPHGDVVHDTAMAALLAVLRELCGPGWSPSQVLLPRARPSDARAYRRFFGAPVAFDAPYAALVLPAHQLGQRPAGADAARHAWALRALGTADGEPLHELLHRTVRVMLVQGGASGDDAAASLTLHRRTLNRRLQALGVSYQAVLDNVRFELARQLLESSGATVTSIAAALGYAEPGPFVRAFRRWSGGTTPQAWRQAFAAGRTH
jgi:AraC-like DNA-binding protein